MSNKGYPVEVDNRGGGFRASSFHGLFGLAEYNQHYRKKATRVY